MQLGPQKEIPLTGPEALGRWKTRRRPRNQHIPMYNRRPKGVATAGRLRERNWAPQATRRRSEAMYNASDFRSERK